MKIDPKLFPAVMQLTFRSGHALMVGHKPAKAPLEAVAKALEDHASEEVLGQFGLFDSSSPNYNTYYPDATEADWNPSDSEFIEPTFRMLSETIVWQYGIPIDFGMDGVLKASMRKMLGQTINSDHDTMVANAIGAVAQVAWQEAYKIGSVKVPAGMNGVFKIDAKANPRLARGIMMDPPSIHSDSVTVMFSHKPSHKFDNRDEFFAKAGTFDKKGKLIRLIVTDIRRYKEVSLVSHGADTFAQKVGDDGKIVNPGMSKSLFSMAANNEGKSTFDFKELIEINNSFNNPNINTETDMKFSEFLLKLGLKEDAFADEAELKAHLEALTATKTSLEELTAVKDDLTPDSLTQLIADADQEPEKAELSEDETEQLAFFKEEDTGTLAEVREAVTLGQSQRTEMVDHTVANFKLIHGDKADATLIENIQEADTKTLIALSKQYSDELEEKVPLTCTKCKTSEHVSRGTAQKTPEENKKSSSFTEKQNKFYTRRKKVPAGQESNPEDK